MPVLYRGRTVPKDKLSGMHRACHQLPIWLYPIFPHYLSNGQDFWGEKSTDHKMCFILSKNFVCNIFRCKKTLARYYRNFMFTVPCSIIYSMK